MAEADLHEGDPGQDHGRKQQRGGDQFRRARAGGGRLLRTVAVVVVVTVRRVVVMGMPMTLRGVRRGVSMGPFVVARQRRRTRKARIGAKQRDQAGENGPEKRQKDDCLIHRAYLPLRMI